MNWKIIYDNIIENSKNRTLTVKSEIHHIIPVCIGGNDDKSNLTKLTLKEHFIVHLLLTKIYDNKKLITACRMMSNFGKYGSRKYEWLKTKFVMSDIHKQRIGKAHKGRILDDNVRKNMSNARKKYFEDENNRQKISQSMIDKGSCVGNKNPMYGKKHSDETKKMISDANKQIVKCPYCEKEGGIAIMKRWHFDRCKNKSNF